MSRIQVFSASHPAPADAEKQSGRRLRYIAARKLKPR
jgi:hypothetical protein